MTAASATAPGSSTPGCRIRAQHEPLLPGPQLGFALPPERRPDRAHRLEYGRYGNPHVDALGGGARGARGRRRPSRSRPGWRPAAASSCRGSVRATCCSCPQDGYPTVRDLGRARLPGSRSGLRRRPGFADSLDGVTFVWVESPSNPGLDVCDIAAAAARRTPPERSSRSTTRLPRRSASGRSSSARTSRWRATRSTSTGHSDLILGHVAVRDAGAVRRSCRPGGRTTGRPGAVRDVARAPLAGHPRRAARARSAPRRSSWPRCSPRAPT